MDATMARPAVSPASAHREGLAWAFAGVAMFSFSVPLTKVAVGGFSPYLTATGRAAIAGVVAAALLAARRVPRPPAQHLRPLLYTMLGAVFGWPILLALALERTTSAHVAVIAAFMPLTTALVAVLRTHERVTWQFWAAAGTGTAALVTFALSRGGRSGGDLVADVLVVGAVLASSWCYVEGASVTRAMPGCQVISWVVVLALPVTIPASALLWWSTGGGYDTTGSQWACLVLLGLSSMYLGFFAWYRGLSLAGIARGGQVQQLQAAHAAVVGPPARRAGDGADRPRRARGDRVRGLGATEPGTRRRGPAGVAQRAPIDSATRAGVASRQVRTGCGSA